MRLRAALTAIGQSANCSVCSVYWCMGQGVLDRFSQVKPKVIFSVEAVRYNAKTHDHMAKLRSVVAGTERETVRRERECCEMAALLTCRPP